jgi:hypothetical protein
MGYHNCCRKGYSSNSSTMLCRGLDYYSICSKNGISRKVRPNENFEELGDGVTPRPANNVTYWDPAKNNGKGGYRYVRVFELDLNDSSASETLRVGRKPRKAVMNTTSKVHQRATTIMWLIRRAAH